MQQLQHRQFVLIVRSHARQNLARIALDDTEAVDPMTLEFDEVADVNEPVLMAIQRLIG
jgi:hypothetical protein